MTGTPQLPSLVPPSGLTFSDRFAFDVALTLEDSGFSLEEVLETHGVSPEGLAELTKNPLFQKKISDFRLEIRTHGVTFKLKARQQAEELLTTSWGIIHDPGTAASVKADLIKSTVKWAGLEPKPEEKGTVAGGGGVRILINLAGAGGLQGAAAESLVIEHEVDHAAARTEE